MLADKSHSFSGKCRSTCCQLFKNYTAGLKTWKPFRILHTVQIVPYAIFISLEPCRKKFVCFEGRDWRLGKKMVRGHPQPFFVTILTILFHSGINISIVTKITFSGEKLNNSLFTTFSVYFVFIWPFLIILNSVKAYVIVYTFFKNKFNI